MKNDFTKETKKIVEKNIKKEAGNIVKSEVYSEIQMRQDVKKFILIVGIIGPLLALFQAAKIYVDKNASGVSLIYWGSYLGVAAIWLGYGIYSKNRSVIFSYGFWIVVELFILNGILLYG